MAPNAQNYDPGVIPGLLSKLKGLGRSKASIARQLDVSRSTLHNNAKGTHPARYLMQYALEQLLQDEMARFNVNTSRA